MQHAERTRLAGPFLPVIAIVVAAAIFVVDTLTDLEIAAAALYVIVILLSVRFCERRGIMLIGAACVVLTLISLALTRTGTPYSGTINAFISIATIAATTYLVLRIDSAQTAIDETRTQLAHVGRVTTLGELTASIAHEVNQPLTAVVTNANAGMRWLAAAPPNIGEANRTLERIVRDANRASDIVGRIRNLAKRAPSVMDAVDLNDMVLATVALVQGQISRSGINLHTELGDGLPMVRGDHVQLQQIVLNLLVNAIESLSGSTEAARDIRLSTEMNRDAVAVAVQDNGSGFGRELDRLFDAFYTTKPGGLGMGLAIARSIVEAHGGRIWAEANQPHGASVTFTVPVVAGRQVEAGR